jgi:hypothetical protein
MPSTSRLIDMWIGICCCHPPFPCIPMGGYIITGSANITSSGQAQARLIETTIGFCGHTGIVISASPNINANTLGKAKIAETVVGCNIGIVITGNPSHNTN